MATTRLMEEMTWPEAAEAARANKPVVIAIGSTEQHGPHLPLNTDVLLPVAVALEAARQVDLVVAPAVRFGAMSRALSGGGETFPGTLSLRASTLISTIHEVLSALARAGFKRICVQNWHYENAGYLWEACDLTSARHPDVRMLLLENPFPQLTDAQLAEIFPKGFPGWDVEHASIIETSLMYVVRPELVRRDKIADDQAARHPAWDVVPAPSEFIPKSGVLWHPTEASEAIGKTVLRLCADHLAGALRTEFKL
ncbi:MAG: creatininase [Candidatus Dormibacterales bacterium]